MSELTASASSVSMSVTYLMSASLVALAFMWVARLTRLIRAVREVVAVAETAVVVAVTVAVLSPPTAGTGAAVAVAVAATAASAAVTAGTAAALGLSQSFLSLEYMLPVFLLFAVDVGTNEIVFEFVASTVALVSNVVVLYDSTVGAVVVFVG